MQGISQCQEQEFNQAIIPGIGYNSLSNITTGFYNTALGYDSLFSNTTGYQNTALG